MRYLNLNIISVILIINIFNILLFDIVGALFLILILYRNFKSTTVLNFFHSANLTHFFLNFLNLLPVFGFYKLRNYVFQPFNFILLFFYLLILLRIKLKRLFRNHRQSLLWGQIFFCFKSFGFELLLDLIAKFQYWMLMLMIIFERNIFFHGLYYR